MVQLIQSNLQTLWEKVQNHLRGQLSAPSFETWIAPLYLEHVGENTARIQTNSTFNRDWIVKHYKGVLQTAFEQACDRPIEIEVFVQAETAPLEVSMDTQDTQPAAQPAWKPKATGLNLNPRYTFEQFVVGNHNRFCHAAALAVAETPAQSYNPLFLYGGVGLGKTHLMQAIGHYAIQHYPNLKVKYVTTEQFTNDLIHALGNQDMKQFRDRYRRIDMLILDDIQFLEGKDRTQEEIFHTFNALHQSGKQVILSSDRSPDRLSRLEDRLRSRFSWGLIADIQPPDIETRLAILGRKAQHLNLTLPDEVAAYIAESFPNNIRELEGALNKISAYQMLTGYPIHLEQAQALLGKRFDPTRISLEEIVDLVAQYYHMKRADLQGALRTKHIAHARQVAIYVVRELTETSFPQIGQLFGGRRHTTTLYAYEKMKELLLTEPTLKQQVQEIIHQVKARTGF